MTTSSERGGWFRLVIYGLLLVFLAALLYREASLGRPLGSLPVAFVCLAGSSHILAGLAWQHAGVNRVFGFSAWVFVTLGAILSVRLMLPI